MTHPLTPREKVLLKPCPFCGGEAVAGSDFDNDHYVMCGADCDKCGGMVGYMKTEMAAIENWNRRTALASGSGDHAELIGVLRSDRLPECSFDDGRTWELDGVGVAETFSRAADVIEALIAEVAALRADVDRLKLAICGGEDVPGAIAAVTVEDCERFCRENHASRGDFIDRATEAERKLAEAEQVIHEISETAQITRVRYLANTFLSKEAERG